MKPNQPIRKFSILLILVAAGCIIGILATMERFLRSYVVAFPEFTALTAVVMFTHILLTIALLVGCLYMTIKNKSVTRADLELPMIIAVTVMKVIAAVLAVELLITGAITDMVYGALIPFLTSIPIGILYGAAKSESE